MPILPLRYGMPLLALALGALLVPARAAAPAAPPAPISIEALKQLAPPPAAGAATPAPPAR